MDNWCWVLHPESINSIPLRIDTIVKAATAKNIILDGSAYVENGGNVYRDDEARPIVKTHWLLMRRRDLNTNYMTRKMHEDYHIKQTFADARFPTIREAVFFHYASLAKGWELPYEGKVARCDEIVNGQFSGTVGTRFVVQIGTTRTLSDTKSEGSFRALCIDYQMVSTSAPNLVAAAVKPHVPPQAINNKVNGER